MEKDDEVSGAGNSNTAEYWQYDPRLGRRWNRDPLIELALSWSPYRTFFDNPIYWMDPRGLFETKKEAREYKKKNNVDGRVRLNNDGTYSIDNKNKGFTIYKDADGIHNDALVSAKMPDAKRINPWQ